MFSLFFHNDAEETLPVKDTGNKKRKRKKVDGEVMDTTHKSSSPVVVVKSGEFIVELLHSVFSQVL